MPSLFCTAVLLLSAGVLSGQTAAEAAGEGSRYSPPALTLSGYEDALAGRLAADGTLDSGMARLRFMHGTEGVPLDITDFGYGDGPQLWAHYDAVIGDVAFRAVCLGVGQHVGEDNRLMVASQVKLSNPTDEPRKVVVSAVVLPSHESPLGASVAFDAAAVWSLDGNTLSRNGVIAASWIGPKPEVELHETTQSPDDPAVTLVWRVEVPAAGKKLLEVKLAGPPSGAAVDEEAWRSRFSWSSYVLLEESLTWEATKRGTISNFHSKSKMLTNALVIGVHVLRQYGAGSKSDALWFTDKPYGQPPTDAAIAPEILGCLVEATMGEYTVQYFNRLIDELPTEYAKLDDERKVAYLHGLARAVRLSSKQTGAMALAEAIIELGDPDVAVEPWHDPRVVGLDLRQIVTSVGLQADGLMTRLRWADVEEGSIAGHMQAARKALWERDGLLVWEHVRALFMGANTYGMGSMDGGEMDARYTIGMWTIARAIVLDDHGDSLNIFPGMSLDMADAEHMTKTSWLQTRFGSIDAIGYFVTSKFFGSWITFQQRQPLESITVTTPAGLKMLKVRGGNSGGKVTRVRGSERLLKIEIDPGARKGTRFQVRVEGL